MIDVLAQLMSITTTAYLAAKLPTERLYWASLSVVWVMITLMEMLSW